MSNTPIAVPTDFPDDLRPLPPRPNLEFERKDAKRFLRELSASDRAALARAARRHPDARAPGEWQLADAQLILAREYGFSSWPKLVAYFETWELHTRVAPSRVSYGPEHYDRSVKEHIRGHALRHPIIAHQLASLVPRYYGMTDEEIFSGPLREADARVLVARSERCADWATLGVLAKNSTAERDVDHRTTPRGRAHAAIVAHDFEAVKALFEAHPELVHQALGSSPFDVTLVLSALLAEWKTSAPEAPRITQWLISQGADLQGQLNRAILGHRSITAGEIEWFLARGADPHWVAPNGVTVIEHLLLRCWKPGPVDVVAPLVTPPRALWIAAGLGNTQEMAQYFDRAGKLTEAARRHRPELGAMGLGQQIGCRPDAEDRLILWEVFFVAALNQRVASIDFLLGKGYDIDYTPWRQNMLHFAVGNRIVPLVELLLSRGASLEVKGERPNASAREMAAVAYQEYPEEPGVRRIYELTR
ncbi:MAG: hypothetical protein ABJC19_10065 [Gemmatimonadota bacterium]